MRAAVVAGKSFVGTVDRVARSLEEFARVTRVMAPPQWLPSRELAVAQLVANGLTNREIAERLFVSPHTVNTHLRHVFAKLEVNSRVDLTRLATERKGEPASETAAAGLPDFSEAHPVGIAPRGYAHLDLGCYPLARVAL
jgi:DNA-binding CsgD family transcriptional regulator